MPTLLLLVHYRIKLIKDSNQKKIITLFQTVKVFKMLLNKKVAENVKHVVAEGENAKVSLKKTAEKQAIVVKKQVVVVKIRS